MLTRVLCIALLGIVLAGMLQTAETKSWRHRQRQRFEENDQNDVPVVNNDVSYELTDDAQIVPLPVGGEGRFGRRKFNCPPGERHDSAGMCRPIWTEGW